eukprot:CAMPEP_0171486434 /NCGR_PEP_ID=MMETSP0958-20121227/1091_1 /TAXON_ID=87120 /ORGANISM="Aurantiochytrium limacinum, Strain ATCCMYA-1381" /LENGTH=39 /DNA_ID= /DNA_START= /DNA_END= /DNA_ORIENTATION=
MDCFVRPLASILLAAWGAVKKRCDVAGGITLSCKKGRLV